MEKEQINLLNTILIPEFNQKFGERKLKDEQPAAQVNTNPEYPNQFFRRNLFTNEIQCHHACHHFNGLNPDKTWFSQGEHPNTTALNEMWGDNLKRQDQALQFFNCVYLSNNKYQGPQEEYFKYLINNLGSFDVMKADKKVVNTCQELVYGKQYKGTALTVSQCMLKCQIIDKVNSLKQKSVQPATISQTKK